MKKQINAKNPFLRNELAFDKRHYQNLHKKTKELLKEL